MVLLAIKLHVSAYLVAIIRFYKNPCYKICNFIFQL